MGFVKNQIMGQSKKAIAGTMKGLANDQLAIYDPKTDALKAFENQAISKAYLSAGISVDDITNMAETCKQEELRRRL